MGRPPIGTKAMTGAERMRRHRARFRHSEPAQDIAENAMQAPVAPLNARIRALELELARERKRREAAEAIVKAAKRAAKKTAKAGGQFKRRK